MSPATADAFGNFGGAFIFGTDESSKLVDEARNICKAACGFASRWKCTGEIYVFADAWASNRRFSLGDAKSIGHICFPPDGIFATGWPKSARLSTFAKRNQVEWFNHRRMRGLYAIQPPVLIQGESCAFQETILVDGPNKMILGRDDLEEVGTW